ncbi:OmpH family outer membrane protein [Thermodesulfobacteriota bacterium]
MKVKNRLMLVFCIFFGLAFCTASFAADSKVGYINLNRLVKESKMGKAAQKEIQKLREKKQALVAKKQTEINQRKTFLDKHGNKLPASERQQKQEDLQQSIKAYKRLVADAKEDITREDRQLVAIILKKADVVLKNVAKKNKYTIILKDPKAIGYMDPKFDITDLVLKELNKKK